MKRNILLAALACVVFGAAATRAAPVTTAVQTITFGPGLTDFANATQNLGLFDSNLGTLTSVSIGASYGFNSNLTITNSAASGSRGNVRTESAAGFASGIAPINSVIQNLIDSLGPLSVGGTALDAAAFDVLGTRSNYTLASGASTTATSTASTVTIAPVTDSNTADLRAFEAAGGGLFDVLFNTATGTVLGNTGGNTGADEVTTATGTLNISYTYTPAAVPPPPPPPPAPVPEPASLVLLGTALLGIRMVRTAGR